MILLYSFLVFSLFVMYGGMMREFVNKYSKFFYEFIFLMEQCNIVLSVVCKKIAMIVPLNLAYAVLKIDEMNRSDRNNGIFLHFVM